MKKEAKIKNTKIKKCPFCGSTEIEMVLSADCYSFEVKVFCKNCGAYVEESANKPNSTFPNPVRNWRARGLKAWNEYEICKNTTERRNRNEKSNNYI